MQDLPDQAAKPMGNHSDGLIVPQARHIAAIADLEDASFAPERRVGGLIENAAHGAVTLRRPVAVVHSPLSSSPGQAPTQEESSAAEGKVAAVARPVER